MFSLKVPEGGDANRSTRRKTPTSCPLMIGISLLEEKIQRPARDSNLHPQTFYDNLVWPRIHAESDPLSYRPPLTNDDDDDDDDDDYDDDDDVHLHGAVTPCYCSMLNAIGGALISFEA